MGTLLAGHEVCATARPSCPAAVPFRWGRARPADPGTYILGSSKARTALLIVQNQRLVLPRFQKKRLKVIRTGPNWGTTATTSIVSAVAVSGSGSVRIAAEISPAFTGTARPR